MSAKVTIAGGTTYRGRTIASTIRTNFGQKAEFTPDRDETGLPLNSGRIMVGNRIAAIVTYSDEFQKVRPISRQRRWESAISDAQQAIDDAQAVYDEVTDAEDDETELSDEEAEEREGDWKERLAAATFTFQEAATELEELQGEYQEWYDNMPDTLQDNSPTGEKLQEIINLSIDTTVEFEWGGDTSDAENMISECECAELPVGWGRD